MQKLIIEFSDERLITPSGLSLVGQMLEKSNFIKKCNNMKVDGKRSQSQIKNGDTPEFLRQTLKYSHKLTDKQLLIRMDSGNDAAENLGISPRRNPQRTLIVPLYNFCSCWT